MTVTELVKGTATYIPCDQWLDKDEGDGQIWRHLMATKKAIDTRKGNVIVFELLLTPLLSGSWAWSERFPLQMGAPAAF